MSLLSDKILRETQCKERAEEFKKLYGDIIKKEKDIYVFQAHGLNCMVYRNGGHLNGYVNIPKNHILYEQGYGELILEEDRSKYTEEHLKIQDALSSINIHGGLTFSGHQKRIDIEGIEIDYCLGFDTAHYNDAYSDPNSNYVSFREGSEYRDAEYVINETKDLAKQIASIK